MVQMLSKIYDQHLKVLSNRQLNDHYYLLELESDFLAEKTKPGQFLNLLLETDRCFFRRPFSVYDIKGSSLFILYMVVGKGTQYMSTLEKGDMIWCLGPLGGGFRLPAPAKGKDAPVLIMGGGTGVGSIFLVYSYLIKLEYLNITLALGFRSKDFCWDELYGLPGIQIYTEDGSVGEKGYVTQALQGCKNDTDAYACGPHGMLDSIVKEAKKVDINVQLSFEEIMACGFGACLGCVITTQKGRQTCCKRGPIFEIQDFSSL